MSSFSLFEVAKRLKWLIGDPATEMLSGVAAAMTTTAEATIIAAQGAGKRLHVGALIVTNSHATVSTEVQIVDGASGAALWIGWAQAGGGGYSISFPPHAPLRLGDNKAITAKCITTGASVRVSATARVYTA